MGMIEIAGYKSLKCNDNVDLIIGEGADFNGLVIQNDGLPKCGSRATVTIGSHVHTGKRCQIRTSDHDFISGYPMVHRSLAGYKSEDVSIGAYTWIGDDVLIMKGVNIGKGVIIQAKSVVVSDIPDFAIVGGHPAKVFSYRSKEDFLFFKSLRLEKIKGDFKSSKKLFDKHLAQRDNIAIEEELLDTIMDFTFKLSNESNNYFSGKLEDDQLYFDDGREIPSHSIAYVSVSSEINEDTLWRFLQLLKRKLCYSSVIKLPTPNLASEHLQSRLSNIGYVFCSESGTVSLKDNHKDICKICGSEDTEYVTDNPSFLLPIFKCNECNLIQTSQISDLSLTLYYNQEFRPERVDFTDAQIKQFDTRASFQKEFIFQDGVITNYKNILDIGAGIGSLIKSFDSTQHELFAIEPDPKVSQYYSNTQVSLLESIEESNVKYDIICASHVLEHANNPADFLNQLSENLNESGIIFIEVPIENVDFLNSSRLTSKSGHLTHFTLDAFESLIKNHTCFEIVKLGTSGPEMNDYITTKVKIRDYLYNRTDLNGIHLRALLKRKATSDSYNEHAKDEFVKYHKLAHDSIYSNLELKSLLESLLLENQDFKERLKQSEFKLSQAKNNSADLSRKCQKLDQDLISLKKKLAAVEKQHSDVVNSNSWKITAIPRKLVSKLK
ncbi:predicted protein [Vibrio maritimus]|uniref:Uncharacterized protein n=1 Tax=Vibrio maritimus TaxID=990268 RepID=A0A090U3N5_9VIBR|nr:predicted protein [Vibrio maritimus]